jgi:hypothetical protein
LFLKQFFLGQPAVQPRSSAFITKKLGDFKVFLFPELFIFCLVGLRLNALTIIFRHQRYGPFDKGESLKIISF